MPSPRGARRSSPPSRPRRPAILSRWSGAAIVALALVLRLAGVGWGLPDGTHFFSFHPDEFETCGRVVRILNTGDWNPEFFNYGSFYLYLVTILAWPFHALGMFESVTGAHVVARVVSALAGAATVLVAERIARRVAGMSLAVWAALFVALAPGHVLHSTFATVDATATLLVAAALLYAIEAREGGRRHFLVAGALAGLAAGTKYATGLVLVAPLLAAFRSEERVPRREQVVRAALVIASAAVAFFIAVPYALITPDRFAADVRFELLVHPREGHLDFFERTGDGWSYHLFANLPYVLGAPLLMLALAGVALLVARRRRDDWLLLAFAFPYLIGLGSSHVRFLRYTLPLVPVLGVAGAVALGAIRGEDRTRRLLTQVAGGASLAWAVLLTGLQLVAMTRPDPRTRAADEISARLRPGSTIGLAHLPWFATPPVTPWNGAERTRSRFESEPSTYRFVVCENWDMTALERARPDVFVMSEFEWRESERLNDPAEAAFLLKLEREYVMVARFENLGFDARRVFGRPFAPHDWLYPFAEVRVWRRLG